MRLITTQTKASRIAQGEQLFIRPSAMNGGFFFVRRRWRAIKNQQLRFVQDTIEGFRVCLPKGCCSISATENIRICEKNSLIGAINIHVVLAYSIVSSSKAK